MGPGGFEGQPAYPTPVMQSRNDFHVTRSVSSDITALVVRHSWVVERRVIYYAYGCSANGSGSGTIESTWWFAHTSFMT